MTIRARTGLMFMILLIPLSFLGQNTDRNTLLIDLSNLGQKISDQAEKFYSLDKKAREIIVEHFSSKKMSEEEFLELGRSIDSDNNQFQKELIQATTQKELIGFLSQKIFSKACKYKGYECDIVKFYIIRMLVEFRILKDMIKEYEQLTQQLAIIDPTALNENE